MKVIIKDKIKILLIFLAIIFLIILKISTKIIINKRFIENYPEANQEIRLILMSFINLYEPYIVPYNYGNYYYQKGRYEAAYDKYIKSLKYKIPKKRECAVRINIGLTLIKISEENEANKIKLLQEAQEHLKKCIESRPDEDDTFDDEELEELQQKASDISKEIGENEGDASQDGNESSNDNGSSESNGDGSSNSNGGASDGNGFNIGSVGENFGMSNNPGEKGTSNNPFGNKGTGGWKKIPGVDDAKCQGCW